MAQAPQKPGAHMRPPDAPANTQPPPQPKEQVNIHGAIPPRPHMALPEDAPEVSDATADEIDAGREALAKQADRQNAEHTAGQKALERHRH